MDSIEPQTRAALVGMDRQDMKITLRKASGGWRPGIGLSNSPGLWRGTYEYTPLYLQAKGNVKRRHGSRVGSAKRQDGSQVPSWGRSSPRESGYDLATDSAPMPVLSCPLLSAQNRSPLGRNSRGGSLFALFPVTFLGPAISAPKSAEAVRKPLLYPSELRGQRADIGSLAVSSGPVIAARAKGFGSGADQGPRSSATQRWASQLWWPRSRLLPPWVPWAHLQPSARATPAARLHQDG